MSEPTLGDDPDLLRVPREVLLETEVEDFDPETELSQLVSRLPTFARTFFLAFFATQLGMQIESLGEDEREKAIECTIELETEGRDEEAALLRVFADFCELYVASEQLSTPEAADEHQGEILALTRSLLEAIAIWAEASERPTLGVHAAELAARIGTLE